MNSRGIHRRHILNINSNEITRCHNIGSNVTGSVDRVNDFLKLEDSPENKISLDMGWQECFDETTGYPYYWNINTNAVTWEKPLDYKPPTLPPKLTSSSQLKLPSAPKVSKFDVPPSVLTKTVVTHKLSGNAQKQNKSRFHRRKSDSDDEKIELITSYGEDSESEDESLNKKEEVELPKVPLGSATIYRIQAESQVIKAPDLEVLDYNLKAPPQVGVQAFVKKLELEKAKIESEEDDSMILNRLRKQAKLLQDLGGEVPQDVEKLIKPEETKIDDIIAQIENERPPDLTPAISLVAGYGDDSDNDEEETNKSIDVIKTLFPILPEQCEPIVESESALPAEETKLEVEEFDSKVFKRKRRIALDVLPTKILKIDDNENSSRSGFGFSQSVDDVENKVSKYGISFVKAETINVKNEEVRETNGEVHEQFEELTNTTNLVKEKIQFLIEGKEDISAEQIMFIQLNTLLLAHQSKDLSSKYLHEWLQQTSTEINKLEQEAVPSGWTCQWDRSNKRYFYRNQASGRTQWEYPTAQQCSVEDFGGEAMDICTTPPPPEEEKPEPPPPLPKEERQKTPPPPTIREKSISPPPPPRISTPSETEIENASPKSLHDQPLPPGVDSPDNSYLPPNDVKDKSLGSELESFYSDIASLDTTAPVATTAVSIIDKATTDKLISEVKKKKKKTKIGSGLTLKKKEVSLLVEKWKKVQNDF